MVEIPVRLEIQIFLDLFSFPRNVDLPSILEIWRTPSSGQGPCMLGDGYFQCLEKGLLIASDRK